MIAFCLLLAFFISQVFALSKPMITSVKIPLCNSTLTLNTVRNGNSGFAFLNLHRNENTSVVAARAFIAMNGGSVSWLEQNNTAPTRLISFNCAGINFTVDPNRYMIAE